MKDQLDRRQFLQASLVAALVPMGMGSGFFKAFEGSSKKTWILARWNGTRFETAASSTAFKTAGTARVKIWSQGDNGRLAVNLNVRPSGGDPGTCVPFHAWTAGNKAPSRFNADMENGLDFEIETPSGKEALEAITEPGIYVIARRQRDLHAISQCPGWAEGLQSREIPAHVGIEISLS